MLASLLRLQVALANGRDAHIHSSSLHIFRPVAQLSYSLYLVHEMLQFWIFIEKPSMDMRSLPAIRELT
jgi:peptidoglycan/LPS O-acetylase OafA/YrhL